MKRLITNSFYVLVALVVLLITACTPAKADAKEANDERHSGSLVSSPRQDLAEIGFYIFPEPTTLPNFTIEDLSGKKISSSSLTGSVILLNFWATWCPPCRKEMPSIENLYTKMQGHDFRIVAVSASEKKEVVKKFIDEQKYTFPIYLDETGSTSATLASQGIPTTYILDKNGLVFAGFVGARDYDDPQLIKIFKELAK